MTPPPPPPCCALCVQHWLSVPVGLCHRPHTPHRPPPTKLCTVRSPKAKKKRAGDLDIKLKIQSQHRKFWTAFFFVAKLLCFCLFLPCCPVCAQRCRLFLSSSCPSSCLFFFFVRVIIAEHKIIGGLRSVFGRKEGGRREVPRGWIGARCGHWVAQILVRHKKVI